MGPGRRPISDVEGETSGRHRVNEEGGHEVIKGSSLNKKVICKGLTVKEGKM